MFKLPSFPCRSVACIMAELLGRKPLFPGKDYVQQLDLITKVWRCILVPNMIYVLSDAASAGLHACNGDPCAGGGGRAGERPAEHVQLMLQAVVKQVLKDTHGNTT